MHSHTLAIGRAPLVLVSRLLLLSILLLAPLCTSPVAAACPRAPSGAPAGQLLATAWINKAWRSVETGVSDRRRMIQLATLGMCIGLYILMRKWHSSP
jgi:hypothetical protein